MTRVTPQKLIDVSNKLNDISGKYSSSVSNFYNLGAKLDTMWDGDASEKFFTALGSDRERLNTLTKILQAYAKILNDVAQEYMRREKEALDAVGRQGR